MGTPTPRSTRNPLNMWIVVAQESDQAVSRIGARILILCKLVDAVLPHLTAAQSRQVDGMFRRGIEDAMPRTDDVVTPGACPATLLKRTNVLPMVSARKSAELR